MSIEKEGASAKAPTTTNNINLPEAYQNLSPQAREKAVKRIAKRRSDMPKIYRPNYDKAISGNSLRAAINAQCLACVQWQRVEVRLCLSTPCPLWNYRPYQSDDAIGCSKTSSEGPDSDSESTNADNKGIGYGSQTK